MMGNTAIFEMRARGVGGGMGRFKNGKRVDNPVELPMTMIHHEQKPDRCMSMTLLSSNGFFESELKV